MLLKSEYIRLTPNERIYGLQVPVIGLTGGISSGKSFVANYLESKGIKVICADKMIKEIYQKKATKDFIRSLAPQVINSEENINFKLLRELVFERDNLKLKLEKYLHPQLENIMKTKISSEDHFIIYDIPLLFENNLKEKFDLVVTMNLSQDNQIKRLCERDKISQDLAKKIIAQQMPLEFKVRNSDFVIQNDGSLDDLKRTIESVLITEIFLA